MINGMRNCACSGAYAFFHSHLPTMKYFIFLSFIIFFQTNANTLCSSSQDSFRNDLQFDFPLLKQHFGSDYVPEVQNAIYDAVKFSRSHENFISEKVSSGGTTIQDTSFLVRSSRAERSVDKLDTCSVTKDTFVQPIIVPGSDEIKNFMIVFEFNCPEITKLQSGTLYFIYNIEKMTVIEARKILHSGYTIDYICIDEYAEYYLN